MLKKIYKESLSDINVSHELIEKTELLMKNKRHFIPGRIGRIKYASAAACLVLVIFSIIIFHKSFIKTLPASDTAGKQSTVLKENSGIHINQLGNLTDEAPKFAAPIYDGVETWTFKQYCDLLGFNPLPTEIPEGLRLIKNDTKTMYFNSNYGRVDFYNTWWSIYTDAENTEKSKCIMVLVNPTCVSYWLVPRPCEFRNIVQPDDFDKAMNLGEKSDINGTKVLIWHKDKGTVWNYASTKSIFGGPMEVTDYYIADFKYKNAAFTITAQNGVTQDEFIKVLQSIIK